MASVSWVRIRSSSLEAFVLDGVGWFPGTQVLEWGIECTIVDFRKVVHSLGGSTQGPDIDRTRQPAIPLLFWHILSCGMGCCLEHEFVNQLSIQTTFSDSQADYNALIWLDHACSYGRAFPASHKLIHPDDRSIRSQCPFYNRPIETTRYIQLDESYM